MVVKFCVFEKSKNGGLITESASFREIKPDQ